MDLTEYINGLKSIMDRNKTDGFLTLGEYHTIDTVYKELSKKPTGKHLKEEDV